MGATDIARSLAPALVHVRHCLIDGEGTSLDVMIATVEGDMGEEDRQAGIHTDHCRAHAQGHLFVGWTVSLQGDDHRAMSVGEQGMEGEEGGLDLEATRCGQVDQGRGPFRVLARGRDHILRIPGTVEAGRGQAAEGGGVSVILGIAGRGRLRDFLYFFLGSQVISFVYSWEYSLPKIHLLEEKKSNVHITSQRKPNH